MLHILLGLVMCMVLLIHRSLLHLLFHVWFLIWWRWTWRCTTQTFQNSYEIMNIIMNKGNHITLGHYLQLMKDIVLAESSSFYLLFLAYQCSMAVSKHFSSRYHSFFSLFLIHFIIHIFFYHTSSNWHHISVRNVLILSSCLHVGLPNGLFSTGLPVNIF